MIKQSLEFLCDSLRSVSLQLYVECDVFVPKNAKAIEKPQSMKFAPQIKSVSRACMNVKRQAVF